MDWNIGFLNAAENLGTSIEFIIILIVNLGMLVFFAKDFKLGLVMMFLGNALLFMWFYYIAGSYVVPLVLMVLSLIMLCFTLFAVSRASRAGVV